MSFGTPDISKFLLTVPSIRRLIAKKKLACNTWDKPDDFGIKTSSLIT